MSKKILVITGGGADGAVTVGRLEALGSPNYSIGVGISTGSLIVPLAVLGELGRLKEFYLKVTQKDITEDSAFKKDGKLNVRKVINRTLRSYIGGRLSVGSSKNLRKTIEKGFKKDDFESISIKNKSVYVGAYSLNTDENTYFSSSSTSYSDFMDWMWASANPPLVFSLLEKKNKFDSCEQWVDGGVKEVMPISFALGLANEGDEIDVFMHRPKREKYFKKNVKNIVQKAGRIIKAIFRHSEDKDLNLGLAIAKNKKVKLNIYWMGYEVNKNSLIFKKEEMQERDSLGFEWGKDKFIDVYDFRED